MTDLLAQIDSRRDDLVALTQDLIRIPTVNPPGDNYREICDFVAARPRSAGHLAAEKLIQQLLRVEH